MSTAQKAFACVSILVQCVIVVSSFMFAQSESVRQMSAVAELSSRSSCGPSSQATCSAEQVNAILSAHWKLEDAYAQTFLEVRSAIENVGYALMGSIALQLLAVWGVLVGKRETKNSDRGFDKETNTH